MFALARRANENPPKLYTFDPKGFRRDVVEFHPDLSRSDAGEHRRRAACLDLGVLRRARAAAAEVARAARYYMTAQVESGHLCPITMTRAALAPLAAAPALLAEIAPESGDRGSYDPERSGRGGKSRA